MLRQNSNLINLEQALPKRQLVGTQLIINPIKILRKIRVSSYYCIQVLSRRQQKYFY